MNFSLILFVLLVFTYVLWMADKLYFRVRRAPDAAEPWWVEYGAGFFPVILAVFVIRSFMFEPFKIPSGSMIPTLLVGDFILVNKYTYGIRLPIINKKVIALGDPQRGDVMVFRYPEDPSTDYIKRVVGLPGDKIAYQNKQLTINGEPVKTDELGTYLHTDRFYLSQKFRETFGEHRHTVLNDKEAPAYVPHVLNFPHRENCIYNASGVTCEVPQGHYFVMGDNRDASSDSRVWGFVPDRNIVGRAFFIWMNFSDITRLGPFD
ncbi:MAG: LepB protein [Pseudomonadota bacterium]